ncbi:hypothetical protein FDUTEX481_07348 [Tolypothrix sp. PCC 7601]|nr:hypothetical protein FDUTEX481_07348 [Tolypothrix sp. PCC 7601]
MIPPFPLSPFFPSPIFLLISLPNFADSLDLDQGFTCRLSIL